MMNMIVMNDIADEFFWFLIVVGFCLL